MQYTEQLYKGTGYVCVKMEDVRQTMMTTTEERILPGCSTSFFVDSSRVKSPWEGSFMILEAVFVQRLNVMDPVTEGGVGEHIYQLPYQLLGNDRVGR